MRIFYCTASQSSLNLTIEKEKGIVCLIPFSLFALSTVECRKPVSLCLEVKALYMNVLLDGFATFYGPLNRTSKFGEIISPRRSGSGLFKVYLKFHKVLFTFVTMLWLICGF